MTIPKPESQGEAALQFHFKCHGVAPLREYQFAAVHGRKWRFDFAFIPEKLAVEVEGGIWSNGRHSRGAGMAEDMRKYNEAAILGWRVLRFSTEMVTSGEAIDTILRALK